jgi:hypothetical protein
MKRYVNSRIRTSLPKRGRIATLQLTDDEAQITDNALRVYYKHTQARLNKYPARANAPRIWMSGNLTIIRRLIATLQP